VPALVWREGAAAGDDHGRSQQEEAVDKQRWLAWAEEVRGFRLSLDEVRSARCRSSSGELPGKKRRLLRCTASCIPTSDASMCKDLGRGRRGYSG
jgi:hypothetical protein